MSPTHPAKSCEPAIIFRVWRNKTAGSRDTTLPWPPQFLRLSYSTDIEWEYWSNLKKGKARACTSSKQWIGHPCSNKWPGSDECWTNGHTYFIEPIIIASYMQLTMTHPHTLHYRTGWQPISSHGQCPHTHALTHAHAHTCRSSCNSLLWS